MGGKGSGGLRPTAPQNNFAVSATGGAGNSGQPSRYISGMPYGQGQALMQQQEAAPMAKVEAPKEPAVQVAAAPVTPLFAPTERPNEPVTHGNDMGPGAGSEILNLPSAPLPTQDSSAQIIRALYMQDPTNEDLRLVVKSLDEAGR
jgi:hypothetical protein